ncbi:hypothetical protein AVEN_124467-1 [Araneus ventricosus]|uniref:Uncharacterized protein n=1 Tax=Araneus ventricosus TaxID=182803 RepID=A0A4Y2W739_ARAVE|nr:hypothetical protein AVEN_154061-1 [Araneus ventricosus]GBO32000.1 hypothetical protein AVEN_124467-1 [Araneus ventricosus]
MTVLNEIYTSPRKSEIVVAEESVPQIISPLTFKGPERPSLRDKSHNKSPLVPPLRCLIFARAIITLLKLAGGNRIKFYHRVEYENKSEMETLNCKTHV